MYDLSVRTPRGTIYDCLCNERPEVQEFGPHMIVVRYSISGVLTTRYLPVTAEITIKKV